jgi:microcystin degradation protein MlrC
MWQETNTYSSRFTTLEDYAEFELLDGDELLNAHRTQRSVIGGFLAGLRGKAVGGFSAAAWPAGLTPAPVYESLIARFQSSLTKTRGQVDGVLLNLHGAMVAEGHPDVENEIVDLIKQDLGDVPVVAVLDFHANPSHAFLSKVDAMVSYTTYPHVDMFERGIEAAHIMSELLKTAQRWNVHAAKLPLLTSPLTQGSADEPIASLMKMRHELSDRTTRFAAMPGFVYSDVARAGFTIAASSSVSDGATGIARLADEVWRQRDEFAVSATPVSRAIDEALARRAQTTVLADLGDNIGGGSTGEGTALLSELLQRPEKSLVVLCDAQAASQAFEAGEQARRDFRLGGRLDYLHGAPVQVAADVVSLSGGSYVASGAWMGGHRFDMGPTAVLQAANVTIIVTSTATPPFHREQITSQGVDPRAFRLVVAKGALAWQDALSDIADGAVFVDTPGSTPARPETLPRNAAFEGDGTWLYPQISL